MSLFARRSPMRTPGISKLHSKPFGGQRWRTPAFSGNALGSSPCGPAAPRAVAAPQVRRLGSHPTPSKLRSVSPVTSHSFRFESRNESAALLGCWQPGSKPPGGVKPSSWAAFLNGVAHNRSTSPLSPVSRREPHGLVLAWPRWIGDRLGVSRSRMLRLHSTMRSSVGPGGWDWQSASRWCRM